MRHFGVSAFRFLWYVISPNWIEMELDCMSIIENRPAWQIIGDVQVLCWFMNIYRHFIRKYANVTAPISVQLKKAQNAGMSEHVKWKRTRNVEHVYQKLIRVINYALILKHFELADPIILQTYASSLAIAGIFNQYNSFGILRWVNIYSSYSSGAVQNYDSHDQKLLAFVDSILDWHQYQEAVNYKVHKECNHKHLKYVQTSNVHSKQQANSVEIVSSYKIIFEHKECNKNPADRLSRRPNYEICDGNIMAWLLATYAVTTISKSYGHLLLDIKAAQETNFVATKIWPILVNGSIVEKSRWLLNDSGLTYERTINVLMALGRRVTRLFLNKAKSGQFRAPKTAEDITLDFYWPVMELEIWRYVAGFGLCHQIKAPHHVHDGLNIPLSQLSCAWEGLTFNFVTNLPESKASGYTAIWEVVNCLTKMATCLPCGKYIDYTKLSIIISKQVIAKCVVRAKIATDRSNKFASWFRDRDDFHISINYGLSTTIHLGTFCQTDHQNQIMEHYLQGFWNYELDNCVKLLLLAEFVYNNCIHHSTLMTPISVNLRYQPSVQFEPHKDPGSRSQVQPELWRVGMEQTLQILWGNKIAAQEQQTKYTGRKEMTFADNVWQSTRTLQTSRLSMKVNYKHTGLYAGTMIINMIDDNPVLSSPMWNQNVFHVSLFNHYTTLFWHCPSFEVHSLIVEKTEKWGVNRSLHSRLRYQMLHDLIL